MQTWTTSAYIIDVDEGALHTVMSCGEFWAVTLTQLDTMDGRLMLCVPNVFLEMVDDET